MTESTDVTSGIQAESPDDNPTLEDLCAQEFPLPEKESIYEVFLDQLLSDADGELTGVHLTLDLDRDELVSVLHALNFEEAGIDDDHGLKIAPITDGEPTRSSSPDPTSVRETTQQDTDGESQEQDSEPVDTSTETVEETQSPSESDTVSAASPDPADEDAASQEEADSTSTPEHSETSTTDSAGAGGAATEPVTAEDFSIDELVREASPNADPTEAIGVLPERSESPDEQRQAFKEAEEAFEQAEEESIENDEGPLTLEYGTAQYWVLRTLVKFGDTLKKPLLKYLGMSDNANNLPSTIYQLKNAGLVVSFNWEQNGNQSVYVPTPIAEEVLRRSEQERVEKDEFQDTVLKDPGMVVLAPGIKIDGKDHPRSHYYDVHGNPREDIIAKRKAVAEMLKAPESAYAEVDALVDEYLEREDDPAAEDAAEYAVNHPKVEAKWKVEDTLDDANKDSAENVQTASDAIDTYWEEAEEGTVDDAVEYALSQIEQADEVSGEDEDDESADGDQSDEEDSEAPENEIEDGVDVHGESASDSRSDKQTTLPDEEMEPAGRRLDLLGGSDD